MQTFSLHVVFFFLFCSIQLFFFFFFFFLQTTRSPVPPIKILFFHTIFDEPKIKLKVINVVTRLCNACDRLTGCNRFQLVFGWFWMIFEMRQLATGITPNLANRKIDWTTVQFSSVLWIFLVHRIELANTSYLYTSNSAKAWRRPAGMRATHAPESSCTRDQNDASMDASGALQNMREDLRSRRSMRWVLHFI